MKTSLTVNLNMKIRVMLSLLENPRGHLGRFVKFENEGVTQTFKFRDALLENPRAVNKMSEKASAV